MYIEIVHNPAGDIMACYCVDTLPVIDSATLFTFTKKLPDEYTQTRVNIDTVFAMEIDINSGPKAILDNIGQPKIVNVSRAEYIMSNFLADVSSSFVKYDLKFVNLKRK